MNPNQTINLSDIIEDISNTLKTLKTFRETSLPQIIAQLSAKQRDSILGNLRNIEEKLGEELIELLNYENKSKKEFKTLIKKAQNEDKKWLFTSLHHYLTKWWKNN